MNKATFTKTQKILIGIAIIVVIGVSVGGCQQQPEKYTGPVDKLTLAAYAGDTGALVYIAQEQGYFVDNGLDVLIKDYESGKAAADALIAGEADISTSADFVLVSNSFEHDNLRVLGTVALAKTVELVTRKDTGINQPGDLKGKKVGTTCKSAAEFFLGTFLTFNNLSLQDIEIVDLKPSEIVDAVVNGDIDAGFTWEPNIFEVKSRLGANTISWPGQSGQDFYFILLTKEKFIEENPQVIERFLRALIRAEEFAKENEAETKKFVETKFNYESSYIDYIWQRHDFTVVLPQALIVGMEDQARWSIDNKLIDATQTPNYLDYIYMDALEEIKPKSIGIIR